MGILVNLDIGCFVTVVLQEQSQNTFVIWQPVTALALFLIIITGMRCLAPWNSIATILCSVVVIVIAQAKLVGGNSNSLQHTFGQ